MLREAVVWRLMLIKAVLSGLIMTVACFLFLFEILVQSFGKDGPRGRITLDEQVMDGRQLRAALGSKGPTKQRLMSGEKSTASSLVVACLRGCVPSQWNPCFRLHSHLCCFTGFAQGVAVSHLSVASHIKISVVRRLADLQRLPPFHSLVKCAILAK